MTEYKSNWFAELLPMEYATAQRPVVRLSGGRQFYFK